MPTYFNPDPKKYSAKKEKRGLKRSSIKQKMRTPTGELELFKKIYDKRKGLCGITKEWVPFHVECFMHVLGKGAYPSFRLQELNILLVQREIHRLYDNDSKEKLITAFPAAAIIYELKEMMKEAYAKTVKR